MAQERPPWRCVSCAYWLGQPNAAGKRKCVYLSESQVAHRDWWRSAKLEIMTAPGFGCVAYVAAPG